MSRLEPIYPDSELLRYGRLSLGVEHSSHNTNSFDLSKPAPKRSESPKISRRLQMSPLYSSLRNPNQPKRPSSVSGRKSARDGDSRGSSRQSSPGRPSSRQRPPSTTKGSSPFFTSHEEVAKKKAERRAKAREQSSRITAQQYAMRDLYKAQLHDERELERIKNIMHKKEKVSVWKKKTEKSPFNVDLLAENERIDEENRVRIAEDERRKKVIQSRKHKVQQNIILRALAETPDLEQLRKERRMIEEEEKKLKIEQTMRRNEERRQRALEQIAEQKAEIQRRNQEFHDMKQQRIANKAAENDAMRTLLLEKHSVS